MMYLSGRPFAMSASGGAWISCAVNNDGAKGSRRPRSRMGPGSHESASVGSDLQVASGRKSKPPSVPGRLILSAVEVIVR